MGSGPPNSSNWETTRFYKNAVVGKAYNWFRKRPSPIRRTAVKPDRKKARSPVMPKLNFENSNDILSKTKEASSFQPIVKNIFNTMPKRGCEWPKGHPDEIDFHFCGKERFEDKPYCAEHCAVAYVIPEKEESEKETALRTV